MDYDSYESMIIHLCEEGHFDKAEEEKKKQIPFLKTLLKDNNASGSKMLDLFSQLAGEAEAFENFSNLLEELVAENLITKSYAEKLITESPAGRWL